VSTGHGGTRATTATVSPIRVVCSNTLAFSDGAAKGKAKVGHRVALDSNDAAQTAQILGIMREQQDMTEAVYSTLKAVTLRQEDVNDILKQLFVMPADMVTKPYADMSTGEKRKYSIVTQSRREVDDLMQTSPYRAQGSDGWSLWNAAVEWSDHVQSVKGKDQEARRAERALMGMSDSFKTKAFDLIVA